MIDAANKDSIHLQRIYKRRKITDNSVQSTMGQIVTAPTAGGVKHYNHGGGFIFWS
jgi:hypothetical protein